MKCEKGYKKRDERCIKSKYSPVKRFISKRFTTKNILISLAVLAGLIILALFLKNYLSVGYMPPTTKGFTQYEGTACGTYQCDYIYGKLLTSNTAEFNTGTNQWKVINSGGGWGSCGSNSQGYIIGGCCTTTQVYKNGILVDTMRQGYSSQNTAYNIRVYCDDGTYDSCPNSIGIGVYPNRWGATVTPGECVNRQNDFQIFLPNNTFSIETTSDKNAYPVGDVIFFNIKIIDNLFDTKAVVRLHYEVPTLFGPSTRTEEKSVNLSKGNNIVNFSLAIIEPSRIIKITPELEVQYKTSNINGVNFNFGTGSLLPITAQEYFPLGSVASDPLELNITVPIPVQNNTEQNNTEQNQTTDDKTCQNYGCPTGYTCLDDGTCKKFSWLSVIIPVSIGIIILIVIIILVVKLKKKRK